MIDIIVSLIGHFGTRQAEVMYIATGIVVPYLVECLEDGKVVKTFWTDSHESALEEAHKFAFCKDA